jgi:hypothetical protein
VLVLAACAASCARPTSVILQCVSAPIVSLQQAGTDRLPTSLGERRLLSLETPPLTTSPLPFVTRTTSRAPAHQFRFAAAPPSSSPSAPPYGSSNAQPPLSTARTSVCFRWNGRRGSVSGSATRCAVSGDGCVCVRHASANVAAVVGASARRS